MTSVRAWVVARWAWLVAVCTLAVPWAVTCAAVTRAAVVAGSWRLTAAVSASAAVSIWVTAWLICRLPAATWEAPVPAALPVAARAPAPCWAVVMAPVSWWAAFEAVVSC